MNKRVLEVISMTAAWAGEGRLIDDGVIGNKNNLSNQIVLGVKIHNFIIIFSIEFLAQINFGKNLSSFGKLFDFPNVVKIKSIINFWVLCLGFSWDFE